jgi:hypothetical protein
MGSVYTSLSPVPEEVVDRNFNHHPPRNDAEIKDHDFVRETIKDVAMAMRQELPPGREASLVQTKLEEAMFWANAAIARVRAND